MEYPAICPQCWYYNLCNKEGIICSAIQILADGNKPLKEYLINLADDKYVNEDYKKVLIENQEAIILTRKKRRILKDFEQFKKNPKKYVIAILLECGVKIRDISRAFKISRSSIYRLKDKDNKKDL